MNGLGNKQIMAKNIQYYMDLYNKTRKEICEAIGVKYTTFTDWVKGNSYPRIDKIEMMANYFGIEKSDLIEEKTEKDVPVGLFTEEEISHLENYRKLDDYGRRTIDLLLERELDRYKQFKRLQHKTANLSSVETVNEPTKDYGKKVIPFAGTANDAPPIPKDEETAPQRKEDPYTVIAAHNDNEDPDQYELMMEDAADLLDDDD